MVNEVVLNSVGPEHDVNRMEYASLSTGRVNFLHSGWYGAVFWICAEHSVDNIEMFLSLLSRVCTEPRPFLLLMLPHWKGSWGCMGGWEEI